MCGICGFSHGPRPERLSRMCRLMAHRGPDGEGFYSDPRDRMNLGHRRLSIIDLSTGDQPMPNESGRIWVILNGEIYNFKELKLRLESTGHRFRTTSDTETIVHLYEDHGLDFVRHLNGMFAIALWDEDRGRLVLARDRLGVKPLYHALVDRRLVFASEMKSILCWPEFERRMDPWAASLYLSLRNVPEPRTIYQGLSALPPAHLLVYEPDNGRLEIQRYWSLDFTPQPWPNEEELCDRLEELLLDAAKLRMRADVPVGAYLSGGVDSSLTVALVRKFHNGELNTFSLGYADKPEGKNDTYYARRIADKFGTTHREMIMAATELDQELPLIVRHLDQPFAGVLSTYFLTKLVRRHVKVVLSGDGADDQFGSYGHHRLVWPLANLARARRAGEEDPYASADLRPLTERLDLIRQAEGRAPWDWRSLFGGFPDQDKLQVLSADFKGWVREHSVLDFYEDLWHKSTAADPLNDMLEVDVKTLLPNEVLYYCDRLSMAHSVEARSPYLDYRVAELAASIPGQLKIKGDVLKYILKKTAARYLPQEILDRPKEGFVLPKHVWLRSQLDGLIGSLLSPSGMKRTGLFDPAAVERLLKEHKTGVRDHAFRIWTLVMFQIWHQAYMESDPWPPTAD